MQYEGSSLETCLLFEQPLTTIISPRRCEETYIQVNEIHVAIYGISAAALVSDLAYSKVLLERASCWFTAVELLTACAWRNSDGSDPLLENIHPFVRPLSVPIMMPPL